MTDRLRRMTLVLGMFVGFVSNTARAEMVPPGVSILYFDYTGQNEQLKMLKKGVAEMLISGDQHLSDPLFEHLQLLVLAGVVKVEN